MILPIEAVLPEILDILADDDKLVLVAEPGAGKTTVLPLRLMVTEWAAKGKIIVIQPRRLSAQTAAMRMAESLGESVGGRVGYRTGVKSQCHCDALIEVVTEGVYLRMLQTDPSMEGWSAVLFDEFHQRSVNSDLALALTLNSLELFVEPRQGPKIIVMSATIDHSAVAHMLDDCAVVRSKGRSFPITTEYHPVKAHADRYGVMTHIKQVICLAAAATDGDVLVFLPGVYEITFIADLLRGQSFDVFALHAGVSAADQLRAINPGRRQKIVLSTNIAETGITVDGVTAVVDSGQHRQVRYEVNTSMSELVTQSVSKASADQRSGRAGRTAPGTSYRCWSRDKVLQPSDTAALLRSDLASLLLELAVWGDTDVAAYRWMDSPPLKSIAAATDQLLAIAAIDGEASPQATPLGEQMSRLGVEPRVAAMLIYSQQCGSKAAVATAIAIAAIVSEADFISGGNDSTSANLMLRLEALSRGAQSVHRGRLARVKQVAARLAAKLACSWRADAIDSDVVSDLLLAAWPDRVAKKREDSAAYLLNSGVGVELRSADVAAQWLIVPQLMMVGNRNKIGLYWSLDESTVLSSPRLKIDNISDVV